MAGSRSNPGQTVTRARGRFGTTSFGSRRRLCPAYLSPAFSFWRVSSYLMTRLSPFFRHVHVAVPCPAMTFVQLAENWRPFSRTSASPATQFLNLTGPGISFRGNRSARFAA